MDVFLLFDSITVREWVLKQLSNFPGIRVIGEAQNPLKALNEIIRLLPDAVIMLGRDQKKFGIDMLQRIRNNSPASKVIMLTTGWQYFYQGNAQNEKPDVLLDTFTKWQKIPEILHGMMEEPGAA
jgi:DNA-binding NarL/FixJ family response regulator